MHTNIGICAILTIALGPLWISKTHAQSNSAVSCIFREAATIAPKNVDLDTAAYAVLAKCSFEINFNKRKLLSRYPGYRDYIESKFRGQDAENLDRARQAIALLRTSAKPSHTVKQRKTASPRKQPLQLVPDIYQD
jgi:hypothetical protein